MKRIVNVEALRGAIAKPEAWHADGAWRVSVGVTDFWDPGSSRYEIVAPRFLSIVSFWSWYSSDGPPWITLAAIAIAAR